MSHLQRSTRPILPRTIRNGTIFSLLLLAFGLRLYQISSVPLNIDEIHTISRYVPLPLLDIFAIYHSNNHPLASALAHLFSPGADHLFMMRWPSILVGMLSLPFVYRLGAGLFGRRVGMLALLLMVVAPVHVGYSMIVRGYIGLVTLTTISLYFLWRAVRLNRWYDWLGVAVTNLLVVYFHLFGVLAAASQLGLVAFWLLGHSLKERWERAGSQATGFHEAGGGSALWLPRFSETYHSLAIKFGLVVLLLGVVYLSLAFAQASAITSNERWPNNDFQVWQDGIFSLTEDLAPLRMFIGLTAPLSPQGIAQYIYSFFFLMGLLILWIRQRLLAIGLVIWFAAPFIVIFVALQLLGTAFYAYVRFLLYLLPPFIILVALGMVTTSDWLSDQAKNFNRLQRTAAYALNGMGLVVLTALIALSINWFALTTTHTAWLDLANILAANLQPQDITICEEHERGFDLPDGAKAYCMWMLDLFVPHLHGHTYTPHFQSSTDFMADYEHLLSQRRTMLEPGGVWLVLWQKIPFRPDDLLTTAPPPVAVPPPLVEFEPYRAWHFGSATLVQIDSETTLFENIRKAVTLLLTIEQMPADQARYYRSLAEMAAVQGDKEQAHDLFEKSWALVEQSGGRYPEMFLEQTQQMIDRIPPSHPLPETAFAVEHKFGTSLCLHSYNVSPSILEAGNVLKLDLSWRAVDFVQENYTFFIQIEATPDQPPMQLEFQPFDGTYPTPWWWAGQRLTEYREFHIPPDLLKQDYTVYLGVYDQQSSSEKSLTPLFSMRYQPAEAHPVQWRIEPLLSSTNPC